nr:unnamed protein product [Callosobruchus analis]
MTFSDFYHWKDHSSKATLSRLKPKVYLSDVVEVTAKRGSLCLEYKTDFVNDVKILNFLKVSLANKRHQMSHPEKQAENRGIPVTKRDIILKNLSSIMPKARLRFWEDIPISDQSNDLENLSKADEVRENKTEKILDMPLLAYRSLALLSYSANRYSLNEAASGCI